MRRSRMALASGLLAAVTLTPPVFSAERATLAAYLRIVERSCAERDEAVLALSQWSPEALEEVGQELIECARCREAQNARSPSKDTPVLDAACACQSPPWAVAALLHTIRALALETGARQLSHLSFAAQLLEQAGDDALRRRWYLTAGLACLQRDDLEHSRSYFEQGLELSEHDPALLVALGTSHELAAWRQRLEIRELGPDSPLNAEARRWLTMEQHRSWTRAADLYGQALTHDPQHAEAHLRLGRVEALRGRTDHGLAMLRWVKEHSDEPDLVYLASLFTGREQMESGQVTAAVASFRAALDADPGGQAAYVAMSHALSVSGSSTAAAEVLERGMATRNRAPSLDSWWRYPEDRPGQVVALVNQLQHQVCR